jgi:hypothetical protein
LNIDDLIAIDVHTHAETSTRMLPDEAAKALDEKLDIKPEVRPLILKENAAKLLKFRA